MTVCLLFFPLDCNLVETIVAWLRVGVKDSPSQLTKVVLKLKKRTKRLKPDRNRTNTKISIARILSINRLGQAGVCGAAFRGTQGEMRPSKSTLCLVAQFSFLLAKA